MNAPLPRVKHQHRLQITDRTAAQPSVALEREVALIRAWFIRQPRPQVLESDATSPKGLG
jgi:hypothetical protein